MSPEVVFSPLEIKSRIAKAQELMKKAKLDSLFLTSDENYHYFTGGAGMTHMRSNARPNIVIIPAEADPIVVTVSFDTNIIEWSGAVKDIRSYTSVHGVPNDLLVKALKDAGLKNRRVGVEMGLEQRLNMPLKDYIEVTKSLPGVNFVDAAEIIWNLRMVKSKDELALMKEACEITGRARQKTFREVKVGMTEREIARLFSEHMLREGGDRVSFIHVMAGLPSNHTYIYLDRPLKRGDVLYLDGGVYVRTYTCDFNRLAIAGKPTPEQERAQKSIRKVNRMMADALKPGLTCSDIWKIGAKALKDEGLGVLSEETGRIGHGQGILMTEPPSISRVDNTMLRPGLVTSTEPGSAKTAGAEFIWEDLHVITEDGSIQLTDESEEFIEI